MVLFQIDGEASFTIQLSQIKQAIHYLTGHSFVVEANVTESLNSITLSGSSKVQIYDHAVKLEYLPSNPKTFKPGLPYTAYVSIFLTSFYKIKHFNQTYSY